MTRPPVSRPTIRDLGDRYRAGARVTDVVGEAYEQLLAVDDPAIVISYVPIDDVLARARALEDRDPDGLPLYGVPFAVKDNIDVDGLDTTVGCPSFAYRPERAATVVARLCAAGAIPIAKTNLDQFATGLVGTRSPYGIPRNPFDASVIPGGSSSGSAVAVALGLLPFALGTDTAGSGRVPAAMTNVVGLKPTCGRVSTLGVFPAVRSLDCVSVFADRVDDAWAVLAAAEGFDPEDPFSRRDDVTGIGVGGGDARRIGCLSDLRIAELCDPDAAAAYRAALEALAALGYSLEPVDDIPFLAAGRLLYDGPWIAERYAAVGQFLEDHASDVDVDPNVARIILGARDLRADNSTRGAYEFARLARATEAVWSGIDVLALPTTPTAPTLDDIAADPIGANARLGTFATFVNPLDLCAISVPGSFRADGLPTGLSLIGPRGTDARVATVGARFDSARHGADDGRPDSSAPAAFTFGGDIELAVVGAHLRGQPLNHELVDLGARFLRATRTATAYRLYALDGTTPPKPGLVRVNTDGAAVAVETWSLTPAAFGRFVSRIPPPLCIGTAELEDGTAVKCFLCEPHALALSQDITSFGGWAAFRASTT